jgi:hypothetical protein
MSAQFDDEEDATLSCMPDLNDEELFSAAMSYAVDGRKEWKLSFSDDEYDYHLGSGSWSKEDTFKLTELVKDYNFDWTQIAAAFTEPSHTPEVSDRYQFLRNSVLVFG